MNSVGDHPQGAGFPHSEIHGSKSARLSPWLIAACYVLHRLSVPRHPPDALITLDHYQAFTWHFLQQIPSHAGTSPAMTGVQPVTDKTALRQALGLAIMKIQTVMITSIATGSVGQAKACPDRTSKSLPNNRRTKPMDLTDPSVHTYPQ